MATSVQGRWVVRAGAFVLWALVAASLAYWGLKLAGPAGAPSMVPPQLRTGAPADPAAVARLLGSRPAAVGAAPVAVAELNGRFSLVGVVAARSRRGAALIAVDGKPARPFRVGVAVDEGLVLQSVEGRRAILAASAGGPALVTLEMPPVKRQ